jgi:small subunit ribosomal protein S11e
MADAAQTEKAFQKQPQIFVGKAQRLQITKSKGKLRYYKNIGLGYKTPRTAIEGTYIDKKCPFTGTVSIRGRILRGICVSNKMTRTIIVRRDYLHWVKKYNRYEKRHRNIPAHCSPAFLVKIGDPVTIGECRPLSKTVRFNVIAVSSHTATESGKKSFSGL